MILHRTRFLKVCTSPSCKIPPKLRQLWHNTTNKFCEEGGQRDYHRLRMCVNLHIEQAQRSKDFRVQSEITERVAVNKGKGPKFLHQAEDRRMLSVEGKWVLSKRRILQFSTYACLWKPRDNSARSGERKSIWSQTNRE